MNNQSPASKDVPVLIWVIGGIQAAFSLFVITMAIFISTDRDWQTLAFMVAFMLAIFIISILFIFVGKAIKEHKRWGRILGILIGIGELAFFPFGTIFAPFVLWYLIFRWNQASSATNEPRKIIWKLLFVVSIMLVFFLVFFLNAAELLSLAGRHGGIRACFVNCASSINGIWKAQKEYSREHSGEFSASFNDLLPGNNIPEECFRCVVAIKWNRLGQDDVYRTETKKGPQGDVHRWTTYLYVAGLRASDPSNCVQILDVPGNHLDKNPHLFGFLEGRSTDHGGFVCHLDGHVREVNRETLNKLAREPWAECNLSDKELRELKARVRIIYPAWSNPAAFTNTGPEKPWGPR